MERKLTLFATRLARITEDGINKQLHRSLLHAPFRIVLNLFKKKNPQLVQNIRNTFAHDVEDALVKIDGFDLNLFVNKNGFTDQGELMMKRSYNIGIRLVKNTGVKAAFHILRNRPAQQALYNDILNQTQEKASLIAHEIIVVEENDFQKK